MASSLLALSVLWCYEDTHAALWRGPQDLGLKLPATSHVTRTILGVPSALTKPLDACSSNHQLECVTPTRDPEPEPEGIVIPRLLTLR